MALGDFSPQARAYACSRPGYPEPLVDELVRLAGVHPGDPVADLGAGTGILSAPLAARGLRVTAVEPNGVMRRAASQMAGVAWRTGTFEATSLGAGSQAWAVAAQAFHWARPDAALSEIARVLRPGACFSVLWNDRDVARSSVLREVERLLRERVPGWEESYRDADWAAVLASTGHFVDVRASLAHHVVQMSRERFLTLWRSHNRLAENAGPAALRAIFADLARAADAADEPIDVPYVCRAWTARRA